MLLLLAAVFSMHGVQCVTADAGVGHGTPEAVLTVSGLEQGHLLVVAIDAVDHQVTGAPLGMTAVAGTSQDGLPVHGATFRAVCLAVLLTGVVLLGVASLIRKAPVLVVRARAPSALWHTGWSRLPRPPDLSALCRLRI
jgi:hypothetical protein